MDTMRDVRRANERAGFHFFDSGTLRFFDSIIGRTLYGGRYFVTSERFRPSWPERPHARRYTVREAFPDGRIETVGEFQQYPNARQARLEIHRLLTMERR